MITLGPIPYEVVDGKFAYWPIADSFSLDDWSSFISDNATTVNFSGQESTSFLRGPENSVTSPFATRYGSGTDWENSVWPTCSDDWWACTSETTLEWNDWYACLESGNPSFHSGPHASIGGRGQRQRKLQGGGGGAMERGDFEDPVTSPNGPIFMFHHANLDRSRLWWMSRHNTAEEVCSYYGFPVANADYIFRNTVDGGADFDGAHLNDVVSSTWGFTRQDLGLSSLDGKLTNTIRDDQVTHADILCWLGPETAPYTYDTNLDCMNDSSLCHSVQQLDEVAVETPEVESPAVVSKDTTEDGTENKQDLEADLDAFLETSAGAKDTAIEVFGLCLSFLLSMLLIISF